MHLSTWRLARHISAATRGQNYVLVGKKTIAGNRSQRSNSFYKKQPNGEEL